MGRITVEVTVRNAADTYQVHVGKLAADQVRTVTVPDALVDTGASTMSLPTSLLHRLGLAKVAEKRVTTAAGPRVVGVYGPARVEIMGRDTLADVFELPEGSPVLVGQLPLEAMDWVIDRKSHTLIGNPAHGGEQVLECWSTFGPQAAG